MFEQRVTKFISGLTVYKQVKIYPVIMLELTAKLFLQKLINAYVFERQSKSKRQGPRPAASSFPKCLQQPGLDQANSQELGTPLETLLHGWQGVKSMSHCLLTPRVCAQEAES